MDVLYIPVYRYRTVPIYTVCLLVYIRTVGTILYLYVQYSYILYVHHNVILYFDRLVRGEP